MLVDRVGRSIFPFAFALLMVGPIPSAHAQVDEDESPRHHEQPLSNEAREDSHFADENRQGVYVVAVPTDEALDGAAQRVGSAARAALRSIDGLEWRNADQRFLGYDDSAIETLDRARARLAEGRDAYLHLDLPRAIEALTAAVVDFDSAAAALENPDDLADALLFLGASLTFEDRTREAHRVFSRLHVQMPHVQPDPNVFSPAVIERFDAARPRDARSAAASIHVDSDPPGAIVYVDFLARGRTPLEIEGLRGGEHVVRITHPGGSPVVQQITLRSHQSEAITARLIEGDRTQGVAEFFAQLGQSESAVREIGTRLGVEHMGVIRVSEADSDDRITLELSMFEVDSGGFSSRVTEPVPIAIRELERGVHQLVARLVRESLAAAPLGASEPLSDANLDAPSSEHASEPPLVEQWWFWTIIGGVAVAVAVGIGVGVAVSEQQPQPNFGQVIVEF